MYGIFLCILGSLGDKGEEPFHLTFQRQCGDSLHKPVDLELLSAKELDLRILE